MSGDKISRISVSGTSMGVSRGRELFAVSIIAGISVFKGKKALSDDGHGAARRGKNEEQHFAPVFHGTKFPGSFFRENHVSKMVEEDKGKKSLSVLRTLSRAGSKSRNTVPPLKNVCLPIGLLNLIPR